MSTSPWRACPRCRRRLHESQDGKLRCRWHRVVAGWLVLLDGRVVGAGTAGMVMVTAVLEPARLMEAVARAAAAPALPPVRVPGRRREAA